MTALRLFAPRLTGAQHVQAHACDDSRQPPCQVFDLARVRAAEPKPRLLHCVVRIAQRSEHAVRDGTKSRPVSFELFGEPVLLVDRALHSRNPQPIDEKEALNVTSAAWQQRRRPRRRPKGSRVTAARGYGESYASHSLAAACHVYDPRGLCVVTESRCGDPVCSSPVSRSTCEYYGR